MRGDDLLRVVDGPGFVGALVAPPNVVGGLLAVAPGEVGHGLAHPVNLPVEGEKASSVSL